MNQKEQTSLKKETKSIFINQNKSIMRKRINPNKVNIEQVGKELDDKIKRVQSVKQELIKDIAKSRNVRFSEAKTILKNGVTLSLIAFEMQQIL